MKQSKAARILVTPIAFVAGFVGAIGIGIFAMGRVLFRLPWVAFLGGTRAVAIFVPNDDDSKEEAPDRQIEAARLLAKVVRLHPDFAGAPIVNIDFGEGQIVEMAIPARVLAKHGVVGNQVVSQGEAKAMLGEILADMRSRPFIDPQKQRGAA